MADVAILQQQVEPTPDGYQIPPAQEIILKSIKCSYDGSGAGGDYIPTLQFVAPNGFITLECPISSTVTAGDDADINWFPRGGVSAAAGSGVTEVDSIDGSITVLNNTGPTVQIGLAVITQEEVSGSASVALSGNADISFSHTSGNTLMDFTTPQEPRFLNPGVYFVNGILSWTLDAHATSACAYFNFGGILGVELQNLGFGSFPMLASSPGGFVAASAGSVIAADATTKLVFEVLNGDSTNAHTLNAIMNIYMLWPT